MKHLIGAVLKSIYNTSRYDITILDIDELTQQVIFKYLCTSGIYHTTIKYIEEFYIISLPGYYCTIQL